MKKVCMLVLALILALPMATAQGQPPATRTVQDSLGRDVVIPYTVERAAPIIGAFAQITAILTQGDGRIVAAATRNINETFKRVFPDYVRSNPNNYNATSIEDLIASGAQVAYGPDVIFSAEQLAQLEAAGIAFVTVNNNPADDPRQTVAYMCAAYKLIGNILGVDEAARAEEFVTYYQGNVNEAIRRTADIPEAERVRIVSLFYSGSSYLTVNGRDLSHEYMQAAGGNHMARDYNAGGGSNALIVDAEQLIAWNPQVIMTSNQLGRDAVLNDPALAQVEAVQNKRVFVCPYGIYMWSVRSGEGAMLPLWLGTKMYPERFSDIDMNEVVSEFFAKYYHYQLTAEELEHVLAGNAQSGKTR